jgi:hypothetical protein
MNQAALRDALVQEIIEQEWTFLQEGVKDGRLEQMQSQLAHPQAFKLARWMAHIIHSEATLQSYLKDIAHARQKGRNLLVDKYALLENALPRLTENPRVAAIAQAESAWLEAAAALYPHAIKAVDAELFKQHLACELETLSDQTLELYYAEVLDARDKGRNLVEVRHSVLCRRMGTSLRDKEAALAQAQA